MQSSQAGSVTASANLGTRRQFNLGGKWARIVNGEVWDFVTVPSSLRPSGTYVLKRSFWRPRLGASERTFLCFEGLTYHGSASVNSRAAGEIDAYIPAEFDISRSLREGENTVEVTLFDLVPGPNGEGKGDLAIGVNPGWEAYGGIIRDVWIETRPQAFIANARLSYEVAADFSRASCKVTAFLDSVHPITGDLTVRVLQGSAEVARASSRVTLSEGSSETDISFNVANPLLWSPDRPHLYTLMTTLGAGSASDTHTCRTGFRHFAIRGRQFEWNRTPLILNGVCRHDMWLDQGFTLTKEQMREDMRAIKRMGANFVRLVHYPHHPYVIELAGELGLLVTEEPGFWQVEFPSMPRPEVEAGLRILEGVIRRDWNSPAVFAWLLGNESRLTVEYLREGKALCNRLDPLGRPVSFANSTNKQEAKKQFEEAGLDFFSQHLYDLDENKFETTADYYGAGKPLVIDEWGWEDAGHGEIFWDRNFDHVLDAIQEGKIAGHAFWSWNDLRQYGRIDWPTHDGILFSGVMSEARKPYAELYLRLSRLFQGQREYPESARVGHDIPAATPLVVPLRIPVVARRGQMHPLDLQPVVDSASGMAAWQSLERMMEAFWAESRLARGQWKRTGGRLRFWRSPSFEIAGVPFTCALRDGFVRPIVITKETSEVAIPVARDCDRLYVLGNVTLPSGYPLEGKPGAVAGSFELRYQDGRGERIPLRNGYEIARSNLIDEATRIEPLALLAPQALTFEKDPAREHYQALLFACPAHGHVSELRCRLESGPPLVIFAVTAAEGATQTGGAQ
ncbi:MAG TPA: glycoside hydrolase family 2 TIM barrel-domain containing protein [Bryobacteraceae bacterium]|nr:glycoside hydrolase family 2 TIM barrel-domain containing protein [Bryobacteraceae bacterium]